ncbi:hypothetical protein F9L33_14175 [Amylibacter sp. SFDW26]|uniref:hypothetical protein n=1 Tax=Amylibacter sp. SFDW26 TaxID=2652722 RepID=UPI001261DE26|nr:hypothetical protein [Amylibacter sp. SFDW26]KAB7610442.1 hypothetical protein F9L33_14175 [Amylibacter sp. SFDW26]
MYKTLCGFAAYASSTAIVFAEKAGPVVETAIEKSTQGGASARSFDNPNIALWILAAVAAIAIISRDNGGS